MGGCGVGRGPDRVVSRPPAPRAWRMWMCRPICKPNGSERKQTKRERSAKAHEPMGFENQPADLWFGSFLFANEAANPHYSIYFRPGACFRASGPCRGSSYACSWRSCGFASTRRWSTTCFLEIAGQIAHPSQRPDIFLCDIAPELTFLFPAGRSRNDKKLV